MLENKIRDRGPFLKVAASMLIFGTVGLVRRNITCSSAFLAFSRGILSGLLLTAYTRLTGKNAGEKLQRSTLLWLIFTGALIGVNWMLLFEAYNHTTVAVATLCYYMEPTIVILLSPLLLRERLTGRKLLCALTAIAGMVLVSGVTEGESSRSADLKGILLGLGAAVCYAFVIMLNKKISRVDAYRRTTVQLLSAGVVILPYLFATGGFSGIVLNAESILLIVLLGIVHTGFAYVMYFQNMEKLKAQTIAMLSYIDPVTALLLSALLLREPLSASGIIGAVMIIGSAAAGEAGQRDQAQEIPGNRRKE